eukprot:gene19411-25286_t
MSANNSLLLVDDIYIDDAESSDRCTFEFEPIDIEDMSIKKLGSYKKFDVFVRKLVSALSRNSESVFDDIFVYSDLESLNTRKRSEIANSRLQRQVPELKRQSTTSNNDYERLRSLTTNDSDSKDYKLRALRRKIAETEKSQVFERYRIQQRSRVSPSFYNYRSRSVPRS